MDLESAIRIIENTAGFDDETTGVGEAWNEVLRHLKDAIPREAVQAAVDLMQAQIERPLVTENRQWNLGRMDGIECGKRSVFRFTGITPKED